MPPSGPESLPSRRDTRQSAAGAERSVAQWFALVGGATLVVVGILGFFADSSFEVGGSIDGDTLLGFEVNGVHNLVHIASGLLLLSGVPRNRWARRVCFIFGSTYALVTIIGLINGVTVLDIIPVNPADNILHIGLTTAALAAAIVSPSEPGGTGP
jgi:hypothetical protein